MRVHTPHGPLEITADSFPLPGAFAVVLPITRRLGLAQAIDLICPVGGLAKLSHGQIVEFLVLQILHSQRRTPLYKLDEWARRNHIEQLYGQAPERFNDDRIARTLDAIAGHISEIETTVVSVAIQQFGIDISQVHWDLTNITFAPARDGSELVRRGYGNGRLHDRQIQVGLNITADGGVPLRHETLPGSTNQTPLGPAMLADLQRRLQRSDLIIVSDRAGLSHETITAYRSAGAHFVGPLGLRAPQAELMRQAAAEAFEPLSYRSMNAPQEQCRAYRTMVEIGCRDRTKPQCVVAALIIFSSGKAQRDDKERGKAIAAAGAKLEKIAGQLNKRRYYHEAYAREKLEKAVPESLSGMLQWELSGGDGELTLIWEVDQAALEAARATDGRYILIYDLPGEPTPDEVFALFRGQHQIEARFRNLGSDLQINPVWLHKDERIAALVLVFVLALIVYTLIERASVRAGLEGRQYHKLTARALLELMDEIELMQVQARGSPATRELRIPQKLRDILHRLGFPDPATYLT